MKEQCETVAQALTTLRMRAELDAFVQCLKDATIPTKPVTAEDWKEIQRLEKTLP